MNIEVEYTLEIKRNTVNLGVMEDAFSIPDNFDEPLSEDIINGFYTNKI